MKLIDGTQVYHILQNLNNLGIFQITEKLFKI